LRSRMRAERDRGAILQALWALIHVELPVWPVRNGIVVLILLNAVYVLLGAPKAAPAVRVRVRVRVFEEDSVHKPGSTKRPRHRTREREI
jgi:hypothetical protein